MAGVRTTLGPVTVRHAGELIESETTAVRAGPNVVVLSTAVPALGVLVTTAYVGADDVDTIAVDLVLVARPHATNRTRVIPRDTLPVTHARERCLIDHLDRVREALAEGGAPSARIDTGDAALDHVASV